MHLSLRILYFVTLLTATSSFCSEHSSYKKTVQNSWKGLALGLTAAGAGLAWSSTITHFETVFCEGNRDPFCSLDAQCAKDSAHLLAATGLAITAVEVAHTLENWLINQKNNPVSDK